MTPSSGTAATSSDSLLPDIPNRSEAEARIERALVIIHRTLIDGRGEIDTGYLVGRYEDALCDIRNALEAK